MEGFSADGYIIDQNYLSDYRYRGMTSDVNGCGWVAAYNLRRAMGHDVPFTAVHQEINAMFPLQIPGPTPMRIMRRYLRRYMSVSQMGGRRRVLSAAASAPCGILRYREENVPHFVTFLRLPSGEYRFFNVADDQEDIQLPMETFFVTHCCCGGTVRLILWA
jgi:hypothetical protein